MLQTEAAVRGSELLLVGCLTSQNLLLLILFSHSSLVVSTQSHSLHCICQDFRIFGLSPAPTSRWRGFIWNIYVVIILQRTEQPLSVVKSLSVKHGLLRQLCL